MKYLTIYKTTHLPTGKFYIGRHITEDPYDSYLGSGRIISAMVKKFPKEEFKKEILKICLSLDDLIESERSLISEVINTPLCLNLIVGDPGTVGVLFVSDETKKVMSESKKKTHNTPEVRKRISLAQQNRSEETRHKLGSANRGKKISQEIRDKLSATISGAGNPRAKKWKIYFENNDEPIVVISAKTWCQERGLKFTSLYMKMRRGDLSFYNGVRLEAI